MLAVDLTQESAVLLRSYIQFAPGWSWQNKSRKKKSVGRRQNSSVKMSAVVSRYTCIPVFEQARFNRWSWSEWTRSSRCKSSDTWYKPNRALPVSTCRTQGFVVFEIILYPTSFSRHNKSSFCVYCRSNLNSSC